MGAKPLRYNFELAEYPPGLLLNELDSALKANDPDTLKCWLCGGSQDLGKPAVEELLLDWLDAFLMMDKISLQNPSVEGVDSRQERKCGSSMT